MRNSFKIGVAAVVGLLALPVLAQDADTTEDTAVDVAEPTANGNGAQVLRETEEVTVDGAVTETVTTQTVSTPSGNVITVTTTTDADGNQITTVDRDLAAAPGRPETAGRPDLPAAADRAERPERAERPDRPERPERPDRPDRPDRPERPETPGRPG